MATPNLAYQERTAYHRHRMEPHRMDWANQPSPYKTYADIPAVALPEPGDLPGGDPWHAMTQPQAVSPGEGLTLEKLAQVLALGNSITFSRRFQGQMFHFRSPASAGALYPNELYIAAKSVDGLPAGLYHHAIDQQSLGCLRSGPFPNLWRLLLGTEEQQAWAALLIVTARYFRSAWKYRTRAFRYVLLDGGHLAGNLGVALNWAGLPWELHTDFDDHNLARFLGIDPALEGGLACIAIPDEHGALPETGPSPSDSGTPAYLEQKVSFSERSLCSRELIDPEIGAIYKAGAAPISQGASDLPMFGHMGITGKPEPSPGPVKRPSQTLSCAQTMLRRRSKRNFVGRALERDLFNALVEMVRTHYYGQAMGELYQPRLLNLGIVTSAVAGLAPGFYLLDPEGSDLRQVAAGAYTDPMAAICLNQAWLAQAAVHFVMMADLKALDTHYGPRGYRRAMIQAGSLGQVIYLSATALGLGACGIGAYYDHEARQLLGLSEDAYLLYLVAAGVVKK